MNRVARVITLTLLSLPAVVSSGAGEQVAAARPAQLPGAGPAILQLGQRTGSPLAVGNVAEVRAMFEKLDSDRDGSLSVAEWSRYVREPSQAPMDDDADGTISPEEWVHSFQEVNPALWEDPGPTLGENLESIAVSACLGTTGTVLEQYRHLAGREPWHPETYVGLACGLERAGDARGADEAFRKAGQLDPNNAEVLLGLAPLMAAAGRLDEARLQIRQGLELLDWSARLREGELDATEGLAYRRAVATRLERRLAKAGAAALTPLVRDWVAKLGAASRRAWRDDSDAVLNVERLLQRGRLEAALGMARGLDTGPGAGAWLAAVHSDVALRAGKTDEAAGALARARAAGAPTGALAALEIALAFARGPGAAAAPAKAGSPDLARFAPWELRELGWTLASRDQPAGALPFFERAQQLQPERCDAVLAHARCLELNGERQAAAALLSRLPELPATSAPMSRFEAGLALRLGLPERAYFAATRATALESGDPVNWLLLVQVLDSTARRDEIPGVLDRALATARMDGRLRARMETIRAALEPLLLLPARW